MFHESLMTVFLKLNCILLNEDLQTKVTKKIAKKIKVENVAGYYQISRQYGLVDIAKSTLDLMERCFSMVTETDGFKELPFSLVKKVLASSSLKIDTEIEVFKAAETWLNFDYKERRKYAKDLLLKLRFPFLSKSALKSLITKKSSLIKIEDCIPVIKSLEDCDRHDFKGGLYKKKNHNYYIRRYYDRSRHDILVGLRSKKGSMTFKLIDSDILTNVKTNLPFYAKHEQFELVTIKGKTYIFTRFFYSRLLDKNAPSFFRFSTVENKLSTVGKMPDRRHFFSVCAFMNNIFVLGGRGTDYQCFNTCLQFCVKCSKWTEVCGMKSARMLLSSAVFEGRIVVSGGKQSNVGAPLSSVEAYNSEVDSWSKMPDMVKARYFHRSVAMRNKLFVIGGPTSKPCEIFDSTCNKFALLKFSKKFSRVNVVLIGNSITVFKEKVAWQYDVIKDVWFKKDFVGRKTNCTFSCTTVPQM